MNSDDDSSDGYGGAYTEEDYAIDRHALAPANLRVESGGPAPAPFENRYTFALTFVEEVEGGTRTWVCLNATGPAASPPPPSESGPVDCACLTDTPFRRFGPVQHLTWIWQADRVRERTDPLYYTAFIPDYFGGEGPCPQRNHPGLLTQWDANWVENDGYGGFSFTDHVARDISDLLDIDSDLQEALNLTRGACPATPLSPPHRGSIDELRQWWAAFVRDVMLRRGAFIKALIADSQWQRLQADRPGLYASLRDQEYFRHGVRGVWVFDTIARVATILEFIRIGVPVFYAWHESMRNAAPALAPPQFAEVAPMFKVTVQRHLSKAAIAASQVAATQPTGQTVPLTPHSPPTPNLAAAKRVRVAGVDNRAASGGAPATNRSPGTRSSRPRDAGTLKASETFAAHKWVPIPQEEFGAADATSAARKGDERELMTVKYRDSTPPPSHEDAAPSLIQRMQTDRAPPLPRRIPYRQRPVPRLRISAEGRAMQVITREADAGRATSAVAIVQVALKFGLPFRTSVAVADPAPSITIPRHVVLEEFRVSRATPAADLWDQWAFGVAHLINREHVARAGLMMGGVFARIIKEFLPDDYVFQYGPSRGVVDYGVPLAYRLECGDDTAVHDDYLSDDERCTLLGYTAAPGAESIWPDVNVLRKCEYEAVWTATWDDWFVRRLESLKAGEAQPLSWRDWKSALRAVGRSDDFSLLP